MNLKDGKLQMMKTDNYSTVDAPFFSDSFLNEQKSGTSTKLGRKVNSVLPFVYNSSTKKYSYQSSTESTHANPINGIYLENSNRNNSTNNLNGVTSSSLTLKYGGSSTSTGIRDGKLWFNSGDSGYGFFPFNNNTGSTSLSNKTYIYTQSTGVQSTKSSDSYGQYPLKHNEKASFENVTDTGNYLTVSESAASNLSYSTKYTVTDVQNNEQITSGSGTSANFKFINSKNEKQMANYNVKF